MAEEKIETPKSLTLGGTTGTLFRDSVPPVYVMKDGKFAIKWGNLFLKKTSLKAIDTFINKATQKKCLKLFRGNGDDKEKPIEAVEMKDDKVILSNGSAIRMRWSSAFYLYDAKIDAEIKAAKKEEDAAYQEYHRLREVTEKKRRKLKSVTRYNFNELIEKHGVDPQAKKK